MTARDDELVRDARERDFADNGFSEAANDARCAARGELGRELLL